MLSCCVEYAVACDIGRVRKVNQDNFVVNGQVKPTGDANVCAAGWCMMPQLFAVCDGMGGEAHGELASYAAASALSEGEAPVCVEELVERIEAADRRVCAEGEQAGEQRGTTVAALLLQEGEFAAANVGDSRVYQFEGGRLRQLSKDHNEFQMMVDAGFYDADDTAARLGRSVLTQCLGIHIDDIEADPHITQGKLQEETLFLLCSDGFCGSVTTNEAAAMLHKGDALEDIAAHLVDTAKKNGSTDNITVLLVRACKKGEESVSCDMRKETDESSRLASKKGRV